MPLAALLVGQAILPNATYFFVSRIRLDRFQLASVTLGDYSVP